MVLYTWIRIDQYGAPFLFSVSHLSHILEANSPPIQEGEKRSVANVHGQCASPRRVPNTGNTARIFAPAPAHVFPTPLPWHLPTGIPTRARAAPRDPHARERSRHRATHSMPSYPRHRASHFRSHMNIIPTRLHGLCDAFSSVSRLSSPHSPDFAFPPSRRTNYLKNA